MHKGTSKCTLIQLSCAQSSPVFMNLGAKIPSPLMPFLRKVSNRLKFRVAPPLVIKSRHVCMISTTSVYICVFMCNQPSSAGPHQHDDDIIALLDSSSADQVMSTLALAADTDTHHHLMTFDPNEPRLRDLHSPANQKHSTLSFILQLPVLWQCLLCIILHYKFSVHFQNRI